MPVAIFPGSRSLIVFTGTLIIGLALVGIIGCQSGSEGQKGALPAHTSNYETIAQLSIPNGGYSRVIVIASQFCTDMDMRRLGEQLKYETRSQRNARVFIYDDPRAAALRRAALDETASKADMLFHDQHLVGCYWKNGNTGFHQLAFGLRGINGPQVMVEY